MLGVLYTWPHFLLPSNRQGHHYFVLLGQSWAWLLYDWIQPSCLLNCYPLLKAWLGFPSLSLQKVKIVIVNLCLLSMGFLNKKIACWTWTLRWSTPCVLPRSPLTPPPSPLLASGLWAIFTHNTSDTKCVVSCPHHSSSCGSYNSVQFWHHLPGTSIRSHKLRAQSHKTAPTSDASYKSQVVTGTFDQTGYKFRGFPQLPLQVW